MPLMHMCRVEILGDLYKITWVINSGKVVIVLEGLSAANQIEI